MMELERTVEALAPGLLRYCIAVTGDPALAEDVAQEALAALVARWRRLGPPEAVDAFVFSIARRRALRTLAKRRLLAPVKWLLNGPAREPSPHACAEARQRLRRTLAAMASLTAAERRALELVVIGDVSLDQAAVVLNASPAALKMRVHRARRRLRSLMEKRHE